MAVDCMKCVKSNVSGISQQQLSIDKWAKSAPQNMFLMLQTVILLIVVGRHQKLRCMHEHYRVIKPLVAIALRYPLEQRQLVPKAKPLVRLGI